MNWEVAPHAIERFIERIRPDLRFNAARAMIGVALRGASRMRERTDRTRDLLYRSATPDGIGFMLVVRPDARRGAMVVVTVLPLVQKRLDLDDERQACMVRPDEGMHWIGGER